MKTPSMLKHYTGNKEIQPTTDKNCMNNKRHYTGYRSVDTKSCCPQSGILDSFIPACHCKKISPDNTKGLRHNAQEISSYTMSVFMNKNNNCLK